MTAEAKEISRITCSEPGCEAVSTEPFIRGTIHLIALHRHWHLVRGQPDRHYCPVHAASHLEDADQR
jgi:hypothetical protein